MAATIIITVLLVIGIVFALRKTIRDRKNGGCGCGCSGCSSTCADGKNKQ